MDTKINRKEYYSKVKDIITNNPSLKSEIGNCTQASNELLVSFVDKYSVKQKETNKTSIAITLDSTKSIDSCYDKTALIVEVLEVLVMSKAFQIKDKDFNKVVGILELLKK